MDASLRNFLDLPYDELEKLNLKARSITDPGRAEATHIKYLAAEKRIKAVMLCFSDLEGRLHSLDYDKDFLLASLNNLTFDGSSINGFSQLHESDLRLAVDWTSITYLPSDVFGSGKVLLFANIRNRDMTPFESDFRVRLQEYASQIKASNGLEAYMAPELEGFVLGGVDAEQHYDAKTGFESVTTGGYYHTLPLDKLRLFIDATADALRAMGFRNEKNHPEVAVSQFEINYSYTDIVRACDQIQLYKLTCRQIANSMGLTATFLPKPIQGINGNGMHTNLSLTKNGKNLFYDRKGQDGLSRTGWDFIGKILHRAPELCLLINSSVNSYRRLDPNFEAPNQIKVSANDRGSMIRIPLGNERSARIEIRSVSPDTNPYIALYAILKTGLEDTASSVRDSGKRPRVRFLPGTINEALRVFKASSYMTGVLGGPSKEKYAALKQEVSNRNPRELGNSIKEAEVLYHHEITNQHLWSRF
ncbi:MAG TPA: glutamine synthetase family protein [Candidatus Saccharimonadales bacterium]|nr:glutamine synthetase family protein [Candidatus Saccharimonadales bacterium]